MVKGRLILLGTMFVVCAGLAYGSAARGQGGRRAQAQQLVKTVRAEVEKLSPALRTKVNWERVEKVLVHASSEPELWLARSALLCEVFNLEDWPIRERLALLRQYYTEDSVPVRRLVVDLLSREEVLQAGGLVELRPAVKDADPLVRILAGKKLLEHGDPVGWPPLLSPLYSDDPKVKAQPAVQPTPHREAKEALIELSLAHWKFRTNAARLPRSLHFSNEHLELAKRTFGMRDNVIRRTVVELIGLHRDRKYLSLLKQRVEAEEAWTVLRSLYISLGYSGDVSVVPILAQAIIKTKVSRVGRAAPATGLAVLGDVSGLRTLVQALGRAEHVPVLVTALSRAFDPDFSSDSNMFLGPDAAGKLVFRYIPEGSSGLPPTVPDGEGGMRPARAYTVAEVHGSWKDFLDKFGTKLKWDSKECYYKVGRR